MKKNLLGEFIERKKAWRNAQARLPMAEKVRIVDALRHRDLKFQEARARRKPSQSK